MSKLRFSDEAEADLVAIWDHLATRSDQVAKEMTAAILAAGRRYAQFPTMGQDRRDLYPGLRSFVVSPYVIFYRLEGDAIAIARVIHGARDMDAISFTEN